jgi:DNA-binding MarR family transcriptional regulator
MNFKNLPEAKQGQLMLAWEREQYKLRKRPVLPCDVPRREAVPVKKIHHDILRDLRKYGASSSNDIASRLGVSPHKIANSIRGMTVSGLVRKKDKQKRDSHKHNNAQWLYEVGK